MSAESDGLGPVRTSLGGWNRGDGSALPLEDYDALVHLLTLLDQVYVSVMKYVYPLFIVLGLLLHFASGLWALLSRPGTLGHRAGLDWYTGLWLALASGLGYLINTACARRVLRFNPDIQYLVAPGLLPFIIWLALVALYWHVLALVDTIINVDRATARACFQALREWYVAPFLASMVIVGLRERRLRARREGHAGGAFSRS